MGHEMHILEGFVLDSSVYGESGRILKILTKEYGVMTVAATGVRELKSKMRGSMDILQLVNFEFVEGREMNRLTGIHELEKFGGIFSGENLLQKRRVVSNVVNFVLRTVVGEVKNEKLWESFLEGIRLLEDYSDPRGSRGMDWGNFEVLWLIKILVSLGYWQEGKVDQFTQENFAYLSTEDNKNLLVEEINRAIKSTHL
jgi:DNA repair protein RecO